MDLKLRALFGFVTGHPKLVGGLSLLLLILASCFLPSLEKDTRSDAFLAADNPALVYKNKVKQQFGLADPIVVAVLNRGALGIYTPETLATVLWLTEEISTLPNINAERVTSLVTEKSIRSEDDELLIIQPFLEDAPEHQPQADIIRGFVSDIPLYLGSLVSKDGHMTLIAAEMIDESHAERTYEQVLALAGMAPSSPGVELYVAGEGAIAGYLGNYIDSDALKLNPIAGLIINLTIILAFFRLNPALLCNVVIGASVLITLGVMAAFDISFFVITNALPVILIGISVADSIHIYHEYYELQAHDPEKPVPDLVSAAMMSMWRPITLTTITTMCGFLGLYFAAFMPPFKYFGLFAAFGVSIAWLYSIFFLPAAIVLTGPVVSRYFIGLANSREVDIFGRGMSFVGLLCLRYSGAVMVASLLIGIGGLYAASKLVVEEDRIDLFHPSEPIYRADKVLNWHMDGTNALDIVVEASEIEGLLEPRNLAKIESLQAYAETLPNVGGSTSIVDYLKQINRSLKDGSLEEYRLPEDRESVAQYFLIYSALADPTDFEEEVDYDYRTANIRVNLKAGSYLDIKPVVEGLQHYVETRFNDNDIKATLSGRVSLNYYWFKDLGVSHFAGLAAALFLVWAVSSLLFRSALGGLYALIPVAGSVLLVYASMVVLGMTLGIGTSMFAAVAIGLGVDFAVHTIDRLRVLYSKHQGNKATIYHEFYRTTGRALFFNFLAIAAGFGVLVTSKIVSLNSFGSIVVLAVTASFIFSLTLLPAMIKTFEPRFIVRS